MSNKALIVISMLFTFVVVVWGLAGDAPFACETNEMYCIAPALEMLRRNELNPHCLAEPASTTIYPLFLYYQFLNATVFHGELARASTSIENLVFDNVYVLCYVPRLIDVMFVVGSIPLIYLIGRNIFGTGASLIALAIFSVSPLLLEYGQVISADTPALFFSLLAIYLGVKLSKETTMRLQVLTGIAIGFAISCRYAMLSLVSLLIAVDAVRAFSGSQADSRRKYLCYGAAGLCSAIAVFALTTPFFFLDFSTFLHDIAIKNNSHALPGESGGALGNLCFYVLEAIPQKFVPEQTALAGIGMLIALARRNFEAALLIFYCFVTLIVSSLYPYREYRFLIPILPILAIFAGYSIAFALEVLKTWAVKIMPDKIASAALIIPALAILVSLEYTPFLACCAHNTAKIAPSTEPLFYRWIFQHLKPGEKICVVGGVWGGGHRERYITKEFLCDPSYFATACSGKYVSPFELYGQGFKYFILSDMYYPTYMVDPLRYPLESRFFRELFENCTLVKEVLPDELCVGDLYETQQRGAAFRLYKFTAKKNEEIDQSLGLGAELR